jgi:hypothetical protein
MKPNIDRKGQVARAITGLICIAFGLALWVFAWPESLTYRWVISAIAIVAGMFQLYEAKRGWCITRACGIKTPM